MYRVEERYEGCLERLGQRTKTGNLVMACSDWTVVCSFLTGYICRRSQVVKVLMVKKVFKQSYYLPWLKAKWDFTSNNPRHEHS
jgi:hypothetical protein